MSSIRTADVDLTGFIDMHVHTAPDVRPRKLDDIEVVRSAAEAGMQGVFLKSHVTISADRAQIAESVIPGIRVFGGLVLNREVGRLNPIAVEAALRLGARQVWLPTFSARGGVGTRARNPNGLTVVDDSGRLLPSVHEVLRLVADAGAIVGTGHIDVQEIVTVVREARRIGVSKVLVTHPDSDLVAMPVGVQRELAGLGVWFERCLESTYGPEPNVTMAEMAARIRFVGPRCTVASTDLGQAGNPFPVEGMRSYVAGPLRNGLSWDEVRLVGAENPAELLGL